MNTIFSESHAPATAEHVTRECNLIARNFACLGAEQAAAATADHMRRFWAPLLRASLLEEAAAHPGRFSPIASRAIATLRSEAARRPASPGMAYCLGAARRRRKN